MKPDSLNKSSLGDSRDEGDHKGGLRKVSRLEDSLLLKDHAILHIRVLDQHQFVRIVERQDTFVVVVHVQLELHLLLLHRFLVAPEGDVSRHIEMDD